MGACTVRTPRASLVRVTAGVCPLHKYTRFHTSHWALPTSAGLPPGALIVAPHTRRVKRFPMEDDVCQRKRRASLQVDICPHVPCADSGQTAPGSSFGQPVVNAQPKQHTQSHRTVATTTLLGQPDSHTIPQVQRDNAGGESRSPANQRTTHAPTYLHSNPRMEPQNVSFNSNHSFGIGARQQTRGGGGGRVDTCGAWEPGGGDVVLRGARVGDV